MKTIVIDTSSAAVSVAVVEGETVLGEFFIQTERTHSQQLLPMAASLLESLGLSVRQLDAVAVCVGPGSFTGVRIGISTAKGFAQPFDLPVYRFSSTRLLSAGAGVFEGIVVSAMDAKRGNVYYGIYRRRAQSVETLEEGILSLEDLKTAILERFAGERVLWMGDAAATVIDSEGQSAHEAAHEAAHEMVREGLWFAASPALNVARASGFADIREAVSVRYDAVDAEYVQKSQAERDHHA
jgi:tRNA threonylcarbamoyladenosine biosynthesis protein TsaB